MLFSNLRDVSGKMKKVIYMNNVGPKAFQALKKLSINPWIFLSKQVHKMLHRLPNNCAYKVFVLSSFYR
jgi:hypothetical protein